jgi:acetyl esterase/lipase
MLLILTTFVGCDGKPTSAPVGVAAAATPSGPARTRSLSEARQGFQTKLTRKLVGKDPVADPPAQLFTTVRYDSAVGKMAAYLSTTPKDGKKRPAIVWIAGGFGNDIGEPNWKEGPAENDQSVAPFRKGGVIVLFPALRGGNEGIGAQEGFYGEVDDVIAAADFLAKQESVDPQRVYLGGHSTGGTLALLVAECSDRFRAVFSFGPVADPAGYGPAELPFNLADAEERKLRSPGLWLDSIKDRTFVFEGTAQGNLSSLLAMKRGCTNPLVSFHPVPGGDHFSVLKPLTKLIATKIVADTGPTCNIAFSEAEVGGLFAR